LDQSLFSFIAGGSGSQYGWFGVLAGASIVFFAFIGFDVVATTAEETRNPQKDVPRGIIASLVIVTVLYVAVTVVLSGMVKYSDLQAADSHPNLSTAFHLNGVDWAAKVIAIGALAGLTTVVMVLMLGQIRVIFAMCRDGLLPRELARTGSHGTPIRITLIVGFLVAIAASLTPIEGLEEIVNVGTLFAFVLVSAGVIVLRRSRPDLPRSFRTPGVPWLPVVAILACGWLMLNLAVRTWMFALAWMVIGVIVYFAYSRRHSVLGLRVAVEK
jgi:APA family basic amino acid/polyamine antiporter